MKKIGTSKRIERIGFAGIYTNKNEELLDLSESPRTYNFTFRGGALSGDLGIDPAAGYVGESAELRHAYPAFPTGVKILGAFPYFRVLSGERDDRIVVHTSENKLYQTKIFESDTWHELEGCTFRGKGCAVNYNYYDSDVLLLASSENPMIIISGHTFKTVADAPRFTSLAVHYERVYGTVAGNRNEVWFSDDFNPENWKVDYTAAGFLSFRDEYGQALKVVSFQNYLYIFREHAIFRLTAYGDQGEFTLKKLFTDTGRIYKPTISLCGDKIIFLAEEGLFAFDGYNVTKIGRELPELTSPSSAVGAYRNNKYYLACKIPEKLFEYYGNTKNNALIEYDLETKRYSVLAPFDAMDLAPVNIHQATDIIVVPDTYPQYKLGMITGSGKIYGTATSKYYFSAYGQMRDDRIKIVREATVVSEFPCVLAVIADGTETEYEISGGGLPQTVFIGKSGSKIGFRITADTAEANISPIIIKYELL